MMFLLDVNVLIAMRYDSHEHHTRVHQWVSQLVAEHGCDHTTFTTCPITELGFVRIGSGKAGYSKTLDGARDDLEDLKSSMDMLFIPDDLRVRHLPAWVRKSAQTTDGYLLSLAESHGGCLATMDRFIPGSVFIPEEPMGPIMVRERAQAVWMSGSRGIELR